MVRESRAGDDFHLLWAARRSIALLDPRSDLRLVRLEGPNPADGLEEDSYLGCDLAEYYGGSTLLTADRVVFSQLKYSTVHASTKWTIATLTRIRKVGGASVIKRLAEMFTGLAGELTSDRRLNVATFCLVGNQQLDQFVVELLTKVVDLLSRMPPETPIGRHRSKLSVQQREAYDKLRKASGLSAAAFADFVRCLDLTGCGADGRGMQKLHLTSEISQVALGGFDPANLMDLMRRQMLPETANDVGLGRAHVIQALGASGEQSLFPYPPRIVMPAQTVATSQAQHLAFTLLGSGSLVLAHGGPGIGKTTTVSGLEPALPPGSVVCVFDCFANGQDLNPAEDRYSTRAVIQIANDIALRTGTLPLVVPDSGVADGVLWQRFQTMLKVAAESLPSDSMLVIVVDAADNAFYAAQRAARPCFIRDLWHIALPANVRVVVTARSGRREDVLAGSPTMISQVQLPTFDLEASSRMLRIQHPAASDQQCNDFHTTSKGIARVQAYAIGVSSHVESKSEAGSLDETLSKARLELPQIFDVVLETALRTVSDPAERRRKLAVLAAMARPASTSTLSAMLGSEQQLQDFMIDLSPALQQIDNRVGFADEDFERHLVDRVSESDIVSAHRQFADYFLGRRDVVPEAAQYLGQHLFLAGDWRRLVDLVLWEGPPTGIPDGFLRAQTFRQRAGYALHAARTPPNGTHEDAIDAAEVVQLLIAAGDAARVDTSLVDTVRQEPGLAKLFADPAAIAQILLDDETRRWRGAMHMRAAALLSLDQGRAAEAVEQIDLAHAWLESWRSQGFPDTGLTAEDIAHLVLAIHKAKGAQAAVSEFMRWLQVEFREQVGRHILALCSDYLTVADLRTSLEMARASSIVQAEAITMLNAAGFEVPTQWVEQIARRIDQFPLRRITKREQRYGDPRTNWGVHFCEVALQHGLTKAEAERLLQRFAPSAPKYLNEPWAARELSPFLRAETLRNALKNEKVGLQELTAQMMPDGPKKERERAESNQRILSNVAKHLLPLMDHIATCRIAVSGQTTGDVAAAVGNLISYIDGTITGRDQTAYRDRQYADRPLTWYRLALEALSIGHSVLMHAETPDAEQIARVLAMIRNTIAACEAELGEGNLVALESLAAVLVAHQTATDVALDILTDGASVMESTQIPATERRDYLLQAARTAYRISPDAAAEIYRRAITVAAGVDTDIGRRVRVLAHLADNASTTGPQGFDIATGLADAVDRAWPLVDDPREQIPTKLVLQAVTRLEPRTGVAAMVKWYQQARIGLSEGLEACLPEAVACGSVSAEEAIALLRICRGAMPLLNAAKSILTRSVQSTEANRPSLAKHLSLIGEWVAFYGSANAHERFIELCRDLGLAGISAAERASQNAIKIRKISPDPEPSRSAHLSADPTGDLASRRAERATLRTLAEDIAFLCANRSGEAVIMKALEAAGRSATRDERVAVLDAVASVADRADCTYYTPRVSAVLGAFLHEWQADSRVRQWSADHLPGWLTQRWQDLFGYVRDRDGYPVRTLVLPGEVSSLYPAILAATSAHLNELDPTVLYATASAVAKIVAEPDIRAAIIEWALSQPGSKSDTHNAGRPKVSVPASLPSLLTWSLLCHEDTRTRWRATHAAVSLLRSVSGPRIASELWHLSAASFHENPVRDFFPQGQEPRSMSAVQALHMALAHVARVQPVAVRHLAAELAETATNRDFPHAVTRHFAQVSVDALEASHPGTIEAFLLQKVRFANQPLLSSVDQQTRKGGERETRGTRFRFDYMDTIPYWLAPVGRLFHNVTTSDVAEMADRWITDRWGQSDDDTLKDALRRGERAWQLIHNDHGRLPTIESLQAYLEYHAMVTVAGQLADNDTPLARITHDEDPWGSWLQHYLPSSTDVWVSDRLHPTPIHPLTYGEWDQLQPQADAIDGSMPPDAHVDPQSTAMRMLAALRMVDTDDDFEIVTAYFHRTGQGWSGSAYLESALVDVSASSALLGALTTFNRPQAIPPSEHEWPDDESLAPAFRLTGMVEEVHLSDGPEAHDPLARRANSNRRLLISEFVSFADLSLDDSQTEYLLPNGTVAARIRMWSDDDVYDHSNDRDPGSGHYLAVRRSLLDAYLIAKNADLVIGAAGSFHPQGNYDRKAGQYVEPFQYWLHSANRHEVSWQSQIPQDKDDEEDD